MPTQGMVASASAVSGILPRRAPAPPTRRGTAPSPRAATNGGASLGSRLSNHRAALAPGVFSRRGTPCRRLTRLRVSAIGKLFGGSGSSDDDDGKPVFAAKSRRQVRIPGFVFAVSQSLVNGDDADALASLEAAVASGATAVILADDTGDATTRELFNAALALKEALR